MKIHEYYRGTAEVNLNGSIAALIPAILIVGVNLFFYQHKEVMLLTIPFLIYSLISFQISLIRMKQSFFIGKNMLKSGVACQTLFDVKHLLVMYLNTQSPRLLFYFPNGELAGELKKYRSKGIGLFSQSKVYILLNPQNQMIGLYKIKGRKTLEISVYSEDHAYLGSYEKTKRSIRKKELLDVSGRFVGAVEGSLFYMDEQILDQREQPVVRLQRGWMPLEWGSRFPEPNTPVLSFKEGLSVTDKLLSMSFLVNEYFIER